MEPIDEIVLTIMNDRKAYEYFFNKLLDFRRGSIRPNWYEITATAMRTAKIPLSTRNLGDRCWINIRDELIIQMDEALQYELDKLPEQAQEHIEKAINHLTNAERKYKETIMNNVPFKTIDYVFGQDIKGMTEDQLLDAIRTVEKEIESYASIKSKSTKVDKRKEELNAALVRIVEALDTK
jgi:hypothetical protein